MSSEPAVPHHGQRRRVTAAMVAQQAGVSAATVSLVVNGKTAGRVSDEIVARVRQTIADLDYVVDTVASSLSKGSGNYVILVAPDIANPYFGNVITGIRQALGPGFQLLLSVTDAGTVPRASDVRTLFSFRPAGLLVDAPNAEFLAELSVDGPIVLLDAPDVADYAPAVNMDVAAGARQLASHLAQLGHRRVGYVDSVTGTATFELRRTALYQAGADLGISAPSGPPASCLIGLEAAAEAFATIWPSWQEQEVTAVVCATDIHAYGVLWQARRLGLTLPDQLAVAGFDNLPYSQISAPALTSVELPGQELGFAAGAHLRAQIEGRAANLTPPLLSSNLIVRDSTAGSRGPLRSR